MRVGELEPGELRRRLAEGRFRMRTGPYVFAITSRDHRLAAALGVLYADFPFLDDEPFADYHVAITRHFGLGARLLGGLSLVSNGIAPFGRFPAHTAPSYTEWGLNWCVYRSVRHYLLLHAATVAREGRGLVLVGDSGQGKSTLCAALVARGWRLLSDEFALIDADGRLAAMPRPISLKNESIEVIRRFAPALRLGPVVDGTVKGTVAHVVPPRESVDSAAALSHPAWMVFPEYRPDTPLTLTPLNRAQAFIRAAGLSFNYPHLGERGFCQLDKAVSRAECFSLTYASLEEATAVFEQRARRESPAPSA